MCCPHTRVHVCVEEVTGCLCVLGPSWPPAELCVLTLSKHPWLSVPPSSMSSSSSMHAVDHTVTLHHLHHHPCVAIGSSSWRGALSLGVWPISGPQRGPAGRGVQGLFDQSGLRCGERQAGRSSRRRGGDGQACEQESRAASLPGLWYINTPSQCRYVFFLNLVRQLDTL